ncbi:MAG: ORF6N domain-containing protein, partial [Candidatus Omnitrophota bacterium]
LDGDLAKLYCVETKLLKRAVRRNISRFPKDFMFELSQEEYKSIRRQFGTFKKGEHAKYLPYAFTQEGVAMLSSVLNSERAIQANVQIMRAFVKLRELMATHENLKKKIEEMEKKYNYQFKIVFDAIKQLLEPPKQEPKKQAGFHP